MPRSVPTPNAKSRKPRPAKDQPTPTKRKKEVKEGKIKTTEIVRLPLSDELVTQGIEACRGNITKMAEAMGQSRSWISQYIHAKDKDDNYTRPHLVALLDEYQVEVQADLAEWQLHEAVSRGEPWAVALVTKSLRKHRYGDKQEIEITDNKPRITEVVVVHHKADSSPLRVTVSGDAPDSNQERVAPEPASGATESLE